MTFTTQVNSIADIKTLSQTDKPTLMYLTEAYNDVYHNLRKLKEVKQKIHLLTPEQNTAFEKAQYAVFQMKLTRNSEIGSIVGQCPSEKSENEYSTIHNAQQSILNAFRCFEATASVAA